jgi:hypothetical protein
VRPTAARLPHAAVAAAYRSSEDADWIGTGNS